MRFTIMAISIGCIMYGFSLVATFVVTSDKEVLKNKRNVMGCVIGMILLVSGLVMFPTAF